MVYLVEAALPVFEAERRRIAVDAQNARIREYWLDRARENGAPAGRVEKAAGEPPSEAKVAAAQALYFTSVDRSFDSATRASRWEDAARLRFDEAMVLFGLAGSPVPPIPEELPTPPVESSDPAT
jgi:hypothetical protein